MNRLFTKMAGIILLALFFAGITLNAQNTLFSEDFGDMLDGWTLLDSSLQQSGDVWAYTTTGPSGSYPVDPIESSTAANGWAVFDSDLLCSGSQNAWLVSPAIDLSGTDTAVLYFQQVYRSYFDQTYVNVSNDGGATWTALEVNAGIPDNAVTDNPDQLVMDISQFVAGSAQAHIAFQFLSDDPNNPDAGCAYSWQIDDIRIDDALPPPPPADPNIIYKEEFDGGANGWTNNNISVATDTARWFWEPTGSVGNGLLAADGTAIQSETADNGAMVFNADLFSTGGDGGQAPDGPPYPQYHSELISPAFDLSSNNFPIAVRFDQLARVLNPASDAPTDVNGDVVRTSISWSTDGGSTWSTPINANPDLAPNANRATVTTEIPIPDVTTAADFRIKFIIALDFYYWVIDDVKIVRRTNHDMRANSNFYAIAPNAVTPMSQVEEFGFLCDIENVGGQLETGVTLNVTIRDESGSVVYTEDQNYGTLAADSLAENVLFGGFTPPALVQQYDAEYSVSADSLDSDPTNNIIAWDFQVSENIFAKETGPTRSIAPADDNSFTYGNVFYVPNGADYVAENMTFAVINADDVEGGFVTSYLYKWDGDTNEDGFANPDELTQLAVNGYTFDGSENEELITIPFDFDGANIPLEDDAYYVAALEYADVTNTQLFYLASEDYDYAAMVFRTDSLDQPRYASLLDVGNTGDFSIVGFGYNRVPLIRMEIGLASSTNEPLSDDNIVKLYPNPATDMMTLDVEFVENAEEVQVAIMDMNGRLLRSAKLNNVQRDTYQLNVSELAAGSYVLRIVTDSGVRSLTFLKQ